MVGLQLNQDERDALLRLLSFVLDSKPTLLRGLMPYRQADRIRAIRDRLSTEPVMVLSPRAIRIGDRVRKGSRLGAVEAQSSYGRPDGVRSYNSIVAWEDGTTSINHDHELSTELFVAGDRVRVRDTGELGTVTVCYESGLIAVAVGDKFRVVQPINLEMAPHSKAEPE